MPKPPPCTEPSDEMNSSSASQVYYHIPEELLETVFEYFFKNTNTTLKNRAAILSTCKTWRRVAEPFLWKHIALIDKERRLPNLAAFTRVLNVKPVYGQLVETFSLSIGDHVKEDTNISDRRKITSLMKNVKSVSISIERFLSEEDMGEAMNDIVKLLENIPRSCEALYFRIGLMTDVEDWIDMPALPCIVNRLCKQFKTIRLEVPPILLSSLFTGPFDNYPELEYLVMHWTHMIEAGSDEDDGGWYSCQNFLKAVACGKVPNLKKALIIKQPTNVRLREWLRHHRFTCVESDLKNDNLLEDSLVVAYAKTPPTSVETSDEMKVELQKLGALLGVSRWSLSALPHHTSLQPARYEFKTFEFGETIIFDIILKDRDLAWARPLNGGKVPWQMATEFGLVDEKVDQCVGAETLDGPYDPSLGLLLLSVKDRD